MPVLRKRGRANQDRPMPSNGLYVHSSPPRALQVNSAYIKQIIRGGDIAKMEQLVYDGQGKQLVGEYCADYKVRTFLKSIPGLLTKINLLHDAVNSGRLEELQSLLDEDPVEKARKLVLAKDDAGVGLLHKAVYYDLTDIAKWLTETYPQIVPMKDSEGRTAYHYTAVSRDPKEIQRMLVNAAVDTTVLDNSQHTAKYYFDHISELELPSSISVVGSRKHTARRGRLNVKKSNIRIWIHQRDLTHLQQVVWEGYGPKLLVEHSNNPKVKKFLEAVPHILGLIKDIHCDVINDDIESLQSHTNPPIPPIVLTGKDANGLTPLHKAAGLGRHEAAEYIVAKYPPTVLLTDLEGRTPLHYAAVAKDDGKMFDYLIEAGADESVLDSRQKSAAYYKNRCAEIDHKVLHVIPEAPRSAKDDFFSTWDWSLLGAATPMDEPIKLMKKTNDTNGDSSEPADSPKTEDLQDEAKTDDVEVNGNGESTSQPGSARKENGAHREGEEVNGNGFDSSEHVEDEEQEAPATSSEPQQEEDKPPEQLEAPPAPVEANGICDESNAPETEPHKDVAQEETTPPEPAPETKPEPEAEPEPEVKNVSRPPSAAPPPSNSRPPSSVQAPRTATPAATEIPEKETDPEPPHSTENAAIEEPEGVIEGIVNGENEIESVNEEGQDATDEDKPDEDIVALVEEGNMEQLAALVLSGEGSKLIGQTSDNPELQAFLENVPQYMAKINRIHVAARDGSLRDLQAALDRRKFAIARDEISPNGATALHVATIFGNTSIVRYLAGRFPETVQTVDDNGRSPLHYAATLNDNLHYYNLLAHLGADIRAEDKFGHNAEYYKGNQEDFSHKSILAEFGAEEEMADEILSDKVPEDTVSARKNLDDPDMIAVLERCYTVLHGRRNSSIASAVSTSTTTSDASATSKLSHHIKKYIFDNVKLRLTKLDHNFYDIIWPSVKKLPQEKAFRIALEQDFPMGIVAPDYYVYRLFKDFLDPMIKDWNCIDHHCEIREHPDQKFINDDALDVSRLEMDVDLDAHSKHIISGTLNCTRNLNAYELPNYLSVGQLEIVERIITTVLLSPETALALYPSASKAEIEDKGIGSYYTMNEVLEDPSEIRVVLAANGLLVPLWNIAESDRLHGKHWPYGRGVFVSSSGNLAVWVNVLDHVRIVTCTSAHKPGNVGQIYSRVGRLITRLDGELLFRKDERLGYLSSRPTAIGNTLQFCLTVQFPQLIKEPNNLRHLCVVRGLSYQKCTHSASAIKISNQQTVGVTEIQTFEDFNTAVANILQLEKDLQMSNSLHIAALFVNIFRRKKSGGLVDSH